VFDSANFRVLAAPGLYAPGRAPPPHLSPFVSGEEEGYVPEYGKQLAALQEAAHAARRRRAAAAAGGDVFVGEVAAAAEGGGGAVLSAEEELEAAEARYAADLAKEMKVGGGGAGVWAEASGVGWLGLLATSAAASVKMQAGSATPPNSYLQLRHLHYCCSKLARTQPALQSRQRRRRRRRRPLRASVVRVARRSRLLTRLP
jgi:pescadillo protein